MKLDGFDIKKILSAAAREGGRSQVNAESDDVKKEWFRHMVESLEKLTSMYNKLNKRVQELEKHECKCTGNKRETIQP